ncbi:MAG: hypothetical protein K9N46_14730 [Candidatus Marinimicrobia bacterium]|nr:hypothetical protein [Candidatus Neomarinimicrobiota bacterium]MCF7828495.1 hypothetical protein [Candidatus Neomarinimicrobiota bacterium]MCF7881985.1 hypothetical protein [Candidatus Neomarinimicrobiota bacterium]
MEFDAKGVPATEASALSDRLRTELFLTGEFKVVERGMMETIFQEQNFQLSGCTSTECLVEVGRVLGVEKMVGGSVSRVGNTFSIAARFVNVESAEITGVATYDYEGQIDGLLRNGMKAVAHELAGQTFVEPPQPEPIPEPIPTATPQKSSSLPHYPWQTLVMLETDKNLEENITEPSGENLIYTTRYLSRFFGLGSFTVRPAVTLGYFRQQVDHTNEYFGFNSYEQDVYMGLAELQVRFEEPDFSFGVFGGIGPGYYKYTTFQYGDFAMEDENVGPTYTSGFEASVNILFIQLVGQVRYLYTPGIEHEMLFPSIGFQTRSAFLSFLPWVPLLRNL